MKASKDGSGLAPEEIAENFADLHPPLAPAQAAVDAARCLYCYEAPCINACPTGINIPTFIHQIRTGNLNGSARTILSANIMGGACARACPTEVLCEEACVVNRTEGAPVKIGALQRYAVDHLMARGGAHPFSRAPESGRRLAVIGAGPAGLSFAHRASMLGHDVVVFEAKPKPGGLNEYGLAAYKMVDDFARREVEFLLGIGGVEIRHGAALGRDIALADLRRDYDAVFIGVGLGKTHGLGVPGEDLAGVGDALDFIEEVRQSEDKSRLSVGKNVVVIGGGNTAIDAAVQAKCLGAETVTLVYRRGKDQMSATAWEQDLASANGVMIRHWSTPALFMGEGTISEAVFKRTVLKDGRLCATDETYVLPADMVLKAIGQQLDESALDGLKLDGGKVWVDASFQTSIPGVYAGGDCIANGEDLTVQAVEDGKRAALSVDARLRAKSKGAA
ncbi:MAG: NAD(P)-dependent oxidoreductase [Parvularculaceae bacterium]